MDELVARIKTFNDNHSGETLLLMHFIGIPMVYLGLLTFLGFISIDLFGSLTIHFGWLGAFALAAYVCMLDVEVGVTALAVLFFLNIFAGFLSQPPSFSGFVLSLILLGGGFGAMFYGHSVEGSKPQPLDYLRMLINGGLAMTAELLFLAGRKSDLQAKVSKPQPKKK
jgi:uncharacterized membrane protein YGL010W